MEPLIKSIPSDLPAWAWVLLVLILVVGIVIIAKVTGNSNKQNVGSNNKISGGVNQQIGNNNSNKDKP